MWLGTGSQDSPWSAGVWGLSTAASSHKSYVQTAPHAVPKKEMSASDVANKY